MHAISSYHGNRPPAHTQTQSQDRLQYTSPLGLVRSVITHDRTKITDSLTQFQELTIQGLDKIEF